MKRSGSTGDVHDLDLLYSAAHMYYDEDMGQSEIAKQLNVSRPTVSRMLSTARERGMVQIKVIHPNADGNAELSADLREALSLDSVYLARGLQASAHGTGMQNAVIRAIHDMGLQPGDGLVISSGMAVYGTTAMDLPDLTGVSLAPAVGGVAEPEPWHQTNEIVRTIAQRTGASYTPIFAGAIPSPLMYQAVQEDDAFSEVRQIWHYAKGSLVGVGALTTGRTSISKAIPQDMLEGSVGDVCLHFFNASGQEMEFPGSDRTIRISLEDLRAIPYSTAIAVGAEKVQSIITASTMKLFRRLVTDEVTAKLILQSLEQSEPSS